MGAWVVTKFSDDHNLERCERIYIEEQHTQHTPRVFLLMGQQTNSRYVGGMRSFIIAAYNNERDAQSAFDALTRHLRAFDSRAHLP